MAGEVSRRDLASVTLSFPGGAEAQAAPEGGSPGITRAQLNGAQVNVSAGKSDSDPVTVEVRLKSGEIVSHTFPNGALFRAWANDDGNTALRAQGTFYDDDLFEAVRQSIDVRGTGSSMQITQDFEAGAQRGAFADAQITTVRDTSAGMIGRRQASYNEAGFDDGNMDSSVDGQRGASTGGADKAFDIFLDQSNQGVNADDAERAALIGRVVQGQREVISALGDPLNAQNHAFLEALGFDLEHLPSPPESFRFGAGEVVDNQIRMTNAPIFERYVTLRDESQAAVEYALRTPVRDEDRAFLAQMAVPPSTTAPTAESYRFHPSHAAAVSNFRTSEALSGTFAETRSDQVNPDDITIGPGASTYAGRAFDNDQAAQLDGAGARDFQAYMTHLERPEANEADRMTAVSLRDIARDRVMQLVTTNPAEASRVLQGLSPQLAGEVTRDVLPLLAGRPQQARALITAGMRAHGEDPAFRGAVVGTKDGSYNAANMATLREALVGGSRPSAADRETYGRLVGTALSRDASTEMADFGFSAGDEGRAALVTSAGEQLVALANGNQGDAVRGVIGTMGAARASEVAESALQSSELRRERSDLIRSAIPAPVEGAVTNGDGATVVPGARVASGPATVSGPPRDGPTGDRSNDGMGSNSATVAPDARVAPQTATVSGPPRDGPTGDRANSASSDGVGAPTGTSGASRVNQATSSSLSSRPVNDLEAQDFLKSLGIYSGEITGRSSTEQRVCVQYFQRSRGISPADGDLTPDTMRQMRTEMAAFQAGNDISPANGILNAATREVMRDVVHSAQVDLNTISRNAKPPLHLEEDGSYGTQTQQALMHFQEEHGIQPADGILTEQTQVAIGDAWLQSNPEEAVGGLTRNLARIPESAGGAPSLASSTTMTPEVTTALQRFQTAWNTAHADGPKLRTDGVHDLATAEAIAQSVPQTPPVEASTRD